MSTIETDSVNSGMTTTLEIYIMNKTEKDRCQFDAVFFLNRIFESSNFHLCSFLKTPK